MRAATFFLFLPDAAKLLSVQEQGGFSRIDQPREFRPRRASSSALDWQESNDDRVQAGPVSLTPQRAAFVDFQALAGNLAGLNGV